MNINLEDYIALANDMTFSMLINQSNSSESFSVTLRAKSDEQDINGIEAFMYVMSQSINHDT